MKLFIDDQFDDPDAPFRHPPDGFLPARSSAEAIQLTKDHGIPEFLSLDHDLGGDDNVMIYLKWLTDNHYDSNVPGYQIHSANPIGAANIHSYMESWKRSQQL